MISKPHYPSFCPEALLTHRSEQTANNSLFPSGDLCSLLIALEDQLGTVHFSAGPAQLLCHATVVRKITKAAEQPETHTTTKRGACTYQGAAQSTHHCNREACTYQSGSSLEYTPLQQRSLTYQSGSRPQTRQKNSLSFSSYIPFPFTQHFLLNKGWDKELHLGSWYLPCWWWHSWEGLFFKS